MPIRLAPWAHAVFVDAKRFLPHLEQRAPCPRHSPPPSTSPEESARWNAGSSPGNTGVTPDGLELVRLTLPRRVYGQEHLDWVADVVTETLGRASDIPGCASRRARRPALSSRPASPRSRRSPSSRSNGPERRRCSYPPSQPSALEPPHDRAIARRSDAPQRTRDPECPLPRAGEDDDRRAVRVDLELVAVGEACGRMAADLRPLGRRGSWSEPVVRARAPRPSGPDLNLGRRSASSVGARRAVAVDEGDVVAEPSRLSTAVRGRSSTSSPA